MAVNLNDPLFGSQWHLKRISVDKIFDEYRGNGVDVGIYDTGIKSAHSDISVNYDKSLEIKQNGSSTAGQAAKHGTAVAGVIAAAANDGIGGVGVASGVNVAGVDIYSSAAKANLAGLISQMSKFDVVNNSWGWNSRYDDGADTVFGRSFVSALQSSAVSGRGGLGTVIVNSAGNDWGKGRVDANSSEFSASRHTITVGAVTDLDVVASYTSRGASLLISAPSSGGSKGIVTSDFLSGGHTTAFGGTSAAAPIVSGVVALMLEANPQLGWRDMQSILALTAERVGSDIGAPKAGAEAFGWTVNGSSHFNGGGMHHSNDYGFGLVDARAAVRMAEAWSNFGPSATSANEMTATAQFVGERKLADMATVTLSTTVTSAIDIEHADLTLKLTHGDVNQLRVELVSPNGTVSQVLTAGSGAKETVNGWTWTLGSEAFRGEASQGDWQVRITDTVSGSTGTLHTASLKLYGAADSANDVYHFTEGFGALAAADASRAVLQDLNWGNDWIDASATTSGVLIDLNPGAMSRVGGGVFSTGSTTAIENVVGGEGNDVLIGSAFDNVLVGGHGNDVFAFVGAQFGADRIKDFEKGQDRFVFAAGPASAAEVAIVASGANTIVGYGNSSIVVEGTAIDVTDMIFAVDLAGFSPSPSALVGLV